MSKAATRNPWIDYLRSFLTILVVAHHASLAYTTFAVFDKDTYIYSTSPVVDSAKSISMDIFAAFNDIFFMSLMFFISGLFVYNGIIKNGNRLYILSRVKRLGIPFLFAVTLIIPFAYIPSYLLANGNNKSIGAFISDYLFHQQWPVGPPWFIWLLLVFNVIAVLIPARYYVKTGNSISGIIRKPPAFFLITFAALALALIPLSLWVGQYTWTGIGPFDFQLNRLILYFLFFISGTCLGSCNWENILFDNNKLISKSWLFWAVIATLCFVMVELFTYYGFNYVRTGTLNIGTAWFIFDFFFVFSCLTSCLAFLAFFRKKMRSPVKVWTNFSSNAFGIYLLHYLPVTWLQYALLKCILPASLKFLIVFTLSLLVSWLIIHLIRKFRIVNQII
jgi:surface polysaccharide O-acyltransferase-like enzyme